MEHQYPGAISEDGNFVAELMLPDQVHNRKEDWTIFFLHKEGEEGGAAEGEPTDSKNGDEGDGVNGAQNGAQDGAQNGATNEDSETRPGTGGTEEGDEEGGQGPPLIYVLNLVNTKHDASVKRYV